MDCFLKLVLGELFPVSQISGAVVRIALAQFGYIQGDARQEKSFKAAFEGGPLEGGSAPRAPRAARAYFI